MRILLTSRGCSYGETTPAEFNYRLSTEPPYAKKASNILCRRYWTSSNMAGCMIPFMRDICDPDVLLSRLVSDAQTH